MGQFLIPVLLPFLLMAAEADGPLDERYPQAIEVFSCKFDETCDANFDAWPDGWTRRRGQGYPSYVKIKIQPISAAAEKSCARRPAVSPGRSGRRRGSGIQPAHRGGGAL